MEIKRIVNEETQKKNQINNPKDKSINLPINYSQVNFNVNNIELEQRYGTNNYIRNIQG